LAEFMPESNTLGLAASGDVELQPGVPVTLRDGVTLQATLYLPGGLASAVPALCTLTPYVAQTHHEQGVYFARHGYPFLVVDVRGRGNSDGDFRPNLQEVDDSYDVVEWLQRQRYCNGKVAMWGGSYMGYAQWAAVKQQPPHLATIVPVAAPCIGTDFPIRRNVSAPYVMQWLTLVAGRALQDRLFADQSFWVERFRQWFERGVPFAELDTFLGTPSASFQEWVAHPYQDDYWDGYNPTAGEYARVSIPVLTITGAYDADQLGALAHYRAHVKHCSEAARARHYLVIGPWDHAGTRAPKADFLGVKAGPASLVDLPRLHLEWYAWTMRGGQKPQFLQKNVAYYVMGAEEWRYADTLDAVTARMQTLYLHSSCNPTDVLRSGLLSEAMPRSAQPDEYVYDPRDISLAELESQVDPENRADQRMIYAAGGRHLVYHSEPFALDTEITGFFKLSLWLSIDQADTDFRALVYEVAIDGSALQLSSDWLRARHRQNFRAERLIDTQAPLRYDFEHFTFISRRICKGYRLRLVIGPINSLYSQKNYNSGGVVSRESMRDARAVTVRLLHDATHPSALYVPLGQPDTRT
jgi:uncharacterized protein